MNIFRKFPKTYFPETFLCRKTFRNLVSGRFRNYFLICYFTLFWKHGFWIFSETLLQKYFPATFSETFRERFSNCFPESFEKFYFRVYENVLPRYFPETFSETCFPATFPEILFLCPKSLKSVKMSTETSLCDSVLTWHYHGKHHETCGCFCAGTIDESCVQPLNNTIELLLFHCW